MLICCGLINLRMVSELVNYVEVGCVLLFFLKFHTYRTNIIKYFMLNLSVGYSYGTPNDNNEEMIAEGTYVLTESFTCL